VAVVTLVLDYDMDTLTSDGKMRDLASNTYHGTITGTITDTVGKIGRARKFPGGLGTDNISPGDVLDFGTGPFTIAGWIRTSSSASIKTVASKWTYGGTARGWAVYTSGTLVMEIEANGTSSSNITSDGWNDGAWHHVAAVFDRNGSTQAVLSLYVDGVLRAGPTTFAGQNGSVDNAENLRIGGNPAAGAWDGDIDEVLIFNHALTTGEVVSLYNESVAESNFENSSVLDVRDAFGNRILLRPEVHAPQFGVKTGTIRIPSGEDILQSSGLPHGSIRFQGYVLFFLSVNGWDVGTWDDTFIWDAPDFTTGLALHQVEMIVVSDKIRTVLKASGDITVRLIRNHEILDSWTGRLANASFERVNRLYRATIVLERL